MSAPPPRTTRSRGVQGWAAPRQDVARRWDRPDAGRWPRKWHRPLAAAAGAGLALLLAGCSYRLPPLGPGPAGGAAAQTSVVLASDGSTVAHLHGPVDRRPVPLSQVPDLLQKAVVATEDQRFWTEPAVDVRAVIRAAVADLRAGRAAQGGSTIAEQYVKARLAGDPGRRTVATKLREATLAYELERHHGRAQILDDYLNTVYLGNGAYGVEAAAETYFSRPVSGLDLAQDALLAGVIHAPTATDPFTHPAEATGRRHEVLDHLERLGLVTPEAARAADAEPLTAPGPGGAEAGTPDPYFVDEVERFVLSDPTFGPTEAARSRRLYSGGLRITTTLDPRAQADADAAVAHGLPGGTGTPDAALVAVDPGTGAVRALVGGRDYWAPTAAAKEDLATQGRRPSGSTFKPFVLTTALARGVPLSRVYSAPSHISIPVTGGTWEVRNYEGEPTGSMNLVDATRLSDNVVYAQLMMQVGPSNVVATAARLGLTTPLAPYPSAVLGTNLVDPLEMASAYGTLADDGVYQPPYMVSEVTDASGRVLYRHRPAPRRAVSPSVARAVDGVLQDVVDQGTGVQARIGRPVAGKTGTTDNWADAWFVGATPQLATAVWVGYPDAERPMVPPATPIKVTGGTWPARVFQLFASAALADQPVVDFPPPAPAAARALAGPQGVELPSVVGMPADQATGELDRAGFVVSTTTEPSSEYPPGYVVSQAPSAGEAPGGSNVTLTVSR